MVRVTEEQVDRVIDRALCGERVSVAELMVLSVLWELQEPKEEPRKATTSGITEVAA